MSNANLAALRRALVTGFCLAAGLAIVSPGALSAQTTVYYACYVPSSGTVYRIKEPGLLGECGMSKKNGVTLQHVEFSWTDGQGANSDHGTLAGLTDDDHPQYMLADGVRTSTNGFVVTGNFGAGTLPSTAGFGSRFIWHPGKAAVAAGWKDAPQYDDWEIGPYSVGIGENAKAIGARSVALGGPAYADAEGAIMLGAGSARGQHAFAAGAGAHASGGFAIALGLNVSASGDHSVVIGRHAHTDDKRGAFVFADASTTSYLAPVADNQFVARAGRFWFGNDNNVTATIGRYIETSTGAYLSSGGTWTNSSDVQRKTGFSVVDGDELLDRLVTMPIQSWSYKDEAASVRHIGPTAQDFRAAFGLGDTDKAIATVDADGVSLAAIQALEKRIRLLTARIEMLEGSVR